MGEEGSNHNPVETAQQEAFKGAFLKLSELKREDGVMTRGNPSAGGLLNRIMTAEDKDINYRQELKTACWQSPEESDLAIEAINERLMCGVSISPLVDKIVARSAGVNASRIREILWAYAHAIVSGGQPGEDKKKHWWQGGTRGGIGKDDPIKM